MNIDILRVHNHWREKRSSLDPLRGVMEVRENNTWREERERGKKKLNAGHGRVNACTRIMATEYPVICRIL